MDLAGQQIIGPNAPPSGRLREHHGYAMAALLVALSVMSVLLIVVMPVWKTTIQREKEEELIFRGQQYVRAIGLFQRRNGPGVYPPSIDVLVDQKFLRRKFKDPVTGQDFLPLTQGQAGGANTPGAQPGTAAGAPGAGGAQAGNTQGAVVQARPAGVTNSGTQAPGTPAGGASGGVMGVVSKSTAKSFRLYNGRSHYNEWQFIFMPQNQGPGGVPGAATPGAIPGGGQRGQGGQGGGQRGGPGGGRGQNPTRPGGRGGAPDPFGTTAPPAPRPNAPATPQGGGPFRR